VYIGAIQSFRIDRVVFGARDFRLGACGSWVDLVDEHKHPFHMVSVTGGVLEEEASSLLKRFFVARRREADAHKAKNASGGGNEALLATDFQIRGLSHSDADFS